MYYGFLWLSLFLSYYVIFIVCTIFMHISDSEKRAKDVLFSSFFTHWHEFDYHNEKLLEKYINRIMILLSVDVISMFIKCY